MRLRTIAAASLTGLALAAAVPALASADPGWTVVATSSDVSRYGGSTFSYLAASADAPAVRVRVRVTKLQRVRVEVSSWCHSEDYSTTDHRDLPAVSRVVRPGKPWTLVRQSTIPGGTCLFAAAVKGKRGRVTSTLAVPA